MRTLQHRLWPELPAQLSAGAVVPGDTDYPWVRSTYMRVGDPGLVLRAASDEDVAAGVVYAGRVRRESGERMPFSIRSGGHGISGSGTNDGGMVLDLSRMRAISLDPDSRLVTVQAGAT